MCQHSPSSANLQQLHPSNAPPPELICPITQELLVDPVILIESGQTYERTAIQQWLYRGRCTDPLTGQKIKHTALITNWAVKNIVAAYNFTVTPTTTPQPLSTHFSNEDCQSDPLVTGKVSCQPAILATSHPSAQWPTDCDNMDSTVGECQPNHSNHRSNPQASIMPTALTSPNTQQYGQAQLSAAAAAGDVTAVELILVTHSTISTSGCQHQAAPQKAANQASVVVALHAAASNGQAAVVKLLVESAACSPEARCQQFGHTPLHSAALGNWAEVALTLLALGANPLAHDRDLSRTALHIAAAMGHTSVLGALLQVSLPLDLPDGEGATPLILAAKAGHHTAAASLLSAGADWSAADKSGMTALHYACHAGNTEVVRELLRAGCDPDLPEHSARTPTPLSIATAQGAEAVVCVLLDAGADINAVDCDQCNAVLRAIHADNMALLRLLVDRGADMGLLRGLGCEVQLPHIATVLPLIAGARTGCRALLFSDAGVEWNPLVDAAGQGQVDLVRMLLQAGGVDVLPVDVGAAAAAAAVRAGSVEALVAVLEACGGLSSGLFAAPVLGALAEAGSAEVVRVLVERGILRGGGRGSARLPLEVIAARGRADVLRVLLDARADDANAACGAELRTPLFYCEAADMARVLLDAGALVDACDAHNRTPLMVCNAEIAGVLLERGADIARTDATGMTALHHAAQAGDHLKLRTILRGGGGSAKCLLAAADSDGCLALHAAMQATSSSAECVHTLLLADPAAHRAINAQDAARRTPLLRAVERGCHAVARYLVLRGADATLTDARGRTPACAAAEALDLPSLRFLLSKGGRVGQSVAAASLESAVCAGKEAMAVLLLTQLQPEQADARHLLPAACTQGMPSLVARMLAVGADPNAADDGGRTVLHKVCENAQPGREGMDPDCIQLLLNSGAKVDNPCQAGSTPLHLAAASGHKTLLHLLLQHAPHSALFLQDSSSATPIHLASSNGHPELVSLLLTHAQRTAPSPTTAPQSSCPACPATNAPAPQSLPHPCSLPTLLNTQDSTGHTPIHHLILSTPQSSPAPLTKRLSSAIHDLILSGANPALPAACGNTPLHLAAATSSASVQLLLPYIQHLNPSNRESLTPLHLAASSATPDHWATVSLLLSAGACPSSPPPSARVGRTLLHLAAASTSGCAAAQQLLQQGFDPNHPDAAGVTPAAIAAAGNNPHVLKLLLAHGATAPAATAVDIQGAFVECRS